MKIHSTLYGLMIVLILAACQPPAPTEPPIPEGKLETQVAATIFALQAAQDATGQATSLTLTAAAPTPTNPPSTPTPNVFTFHLEAFACWVDTGLALAAGKTVVIDAGGMANTSGGRDISNGGPDGQPANQCGAIECPLRGAQYGTLIGRVGEGETFVVGSHLELTPAEAGKLFLTINDWDCTDNSGGFDISINLE